MLNFFRRKKKPRKSPRSSRRRIPRGLQSDKEILLKLDAIITFLRKHDMDVNYKLDQVAVARKVLKETKLGDIIQGKLSQGMSPAEIVRELVSQGACSRATAYRYISRMSVPISVSKKSQ